MLAVGMLLMCNLARQVVSSGTWQSPGRRPVGPVNINGSRTDGQIGGDWIVVITMKATQRNATSAIIIIMTIGRPIILMLVAVIVIISQSFLFNPIDHQRHQPATCNLRPAIG